MTDFTTPRTWNVGELVTKNMLDEQIRNNMNAIWVGTTSGDMEYYSLSNRKARIAMTAGGAFRSSAAGVPQWFSLTEGDLLYRNATILTRLPIGTAGKILVSDGTNPAYTEAGKSWGAGAYRASNQAINNAVYTPITFTAELWDSGTNWTTGANGSKIFAPVAGTYLIVGQVTYDVNDMNLRETNIYINGSPVCVDSRLAVAAAETATTISTIQRMSAGQYAQLYAWQNSGDVLNVIGGNYSTQLAITLLGT